HPAAPVTAPCLARARVALVPLRIGSGTRIKALDAMAAGRPVVGTTIGLGGLELERGRHALIEDEPCAMASAIVELLTDDELARRLAADGRDFVERRYGWQRIADGFVEVLLNGS